MNSKKKQAQQEALKRFKLCYTLLSDTDKRTVDNLVHELPQLVVQTSIKERKKVKKKNRIANIAFLKKEGFSATGYARDAKESYDNIKDLFTGDTPAESSHDQNLEKYFNIASTTLTSNVLVRFVPTGLKFPSKRLSILKAPQGWHFQELNVFEKFCHLSSDLQMAVINHCHFLLEQIVKKEN